jgi:hypothetical protein
VHRHEAAHRRIRAAQLFVAQCQGNGIPPAAAVFLGQRAAEEAQVGHLFDQDGRHLAALVHLAGQRRAALLSEGAHLGLNVSLSVGEGEVHGS